MFCPRCGREVGDQALFCPGCGFDLNSDHCDATKPAETTLDTKKIKKRRGPLRIVFAILAVLVVGYLVIGYLEKNLVKSTAESYLDFIKNGPDEATMDMILDEAVASLSESDSTIGYIASLILDNIKGEDVLDVYRALTRNMRYKVKDVEKIKAGHYRLSIYIENVNNVKVGISVINALIDRYTANGLIGNIVNIISDIKSDKSKNIAGIIEAESDSIFAANVDSDFVYGTFVIDVIKENGKWTPYNEDNFKGFALTCAGIPIQ